MLRVDQVSEGLRRKGVAVIQELCGKYFPCSRSLYYFTSVLGVVLKWLLVLKFISYQKWGGQLNINFPR